MKQRYLEVTFRKGKPLAAYLYLPRPSQAKVARTADVGNGLIVDFDVSEAAIGIEITAPSIVTIGQLNAVLDSLGLARVEEVEWAPLAA